MDYFGTPGFELFLLWSSINDVKYITGIDDDSGTTY